MHLNIDTTSRQVFIATSRLHEAGMVHENLLRVRCRNIIHVPCLLKELVLVKNCQFGEDIQIERHGEVANSTLPMGNECFIII